VPALSKSQVRVLTLNGNEITDEGLKWLCRSLSQNKIKSLQLANNKFGIGIYRAKKTRINILKETVEIVTQSPLSWEELLQRHEDLYLNSPHS